ncbi:MAG: UDP-N-acetylmuramate dehydrogenase [Epsilonproteobacteria bacterium]|nr:UDP-N-acetylmuramate dehydrogenase [Campylobacterota bacterium]
MIIDFSRYSSIKIGPVLEVKEITPENYNNEFIIGKATNTLISPNAKNLGVISKKFDYIHIKNGYLYVGAAASNKKLYNFAKKHNIGGFEFLRNLPGCIGGSVKMNAGVKDEEIFNSLLAVKSHKLIEKKDIPHSYRYSAINYPVFEAVFEIKGEYNPQKDEFLKNLRKNQPKGASLGSVFKNPKDDFAGRLIENAGLKGTKKGGILISPKHANFFINTGDGTFEDMMHLINLTQQRVFETSGINLELEIQII